MSITEDDIRLEQLRKLRGLTAPQPQPDVVPPSQAMVPPDLSAYQHAAQLEQQAAPPPDPYAGMGTGKQMLMRGLAGAAGGAIHAQDPGGYTGYLDHQQQVERQREQDLLGRAKELRGEGYQRERDFTQDQQVQQVRELRQQEMQRTQEVQDRPQFKEFGTAGGGIEFGQVDPRNAQFTQQGSIPGTTQDKAAAIDKNIGNYVNKTGHHVEIFQKPDGETYERPFGEVRPQAVGGAGGGAGQIIQVPDPDRPGNTIPIRVRPDNTTQVIQPPKQGISLSNPTTQTKATSEKLQTAARDARSKYDTLSKLLAQKTSAGDTDAIAKYFDVIMPAVGRRFSQTEIDNIQRIGDVQARARVMLQKFGSRALFDDSARQEILQSAKINTDAAQRDWEEYQNGRNSGGGSGTAPQKLKRTNNRTKEVQFSDDGGKTWHN